MTHRTIFRDDLLSGQVAVVTGGGTGIGSSVARELGQMGAQVVIASRKTKHIEPAAAGLSEELGRPVTGLICDIRSEDDTAGLVAEVIARHGRIDVLVNNGGGQFLSPAELIRSKGWRAVIETNLTGTWNMTRAAFDGWMSRHGGRIINITLDTRRGFPGMAHSTAARGGVEAMSRVLAVEWASFGVHINCVQPGLIRSNGIHNYPNGINLARQLQSEIPLKRLGTREEIARAVGFLASPGGDYITGEVLIVDGGRRLWGNTWPIADPPEMPPVEIPVEPWERDDD